MNSNTMTTKEALKVSTDIPAKESLKVLTPCSRAAIKTPNKRSKAKADDIGTVKLATKSPSDEVASPFTKLLLGSSDRPMTQKEIARVLFANNANRRHAMRMATMKENKPRNTPVKKASAKKFRPYKSPTDAMVSPATRLVRSRSGKPGTSFNHENEAPPPFLLAQKPKSFDLQKSFRMRASSNARYNSTSVGPNKLKKSSRNNGSNGSLSKLGERSANDHAFTPTSII